MPNFSISPPRSQSQSSRDFGEESETSATVAVENNGETFKYRQDGDDLRQEKYTDAAGVLKNYDQENQNSGRHDVDQAQRGDLQPEAAIDAPGVSTSSVQSDQDLREDSETSAVVAVQNNGQSFQDKQHGDDIKEEHTDATGVQRNYDRENQKTRRDDVNQGQRDDLEPEAGIDVPGDSTSSVVQSNQDFAEESETTSPITVENRGQTKDKQDGDDLKQEEYTDASEVPKNYDQENRSAESDGVEQRQDRNFEAEAEIYAVGDSKSSVQTDDGNEEVSAKPTKMELLQSIEQALLKESADVKAGTQEPEKEQLIRIEERKLALLHQDAVRVIRNDVPLERLENEDSENTDLYPQGYMQKQSAKMKEASISKMGKMSQCSHDVDDVKGLWAGLSLPGSPAPLTDEQKMQQRLSAESVGEPEKVKVESAFGSTNISVNRHGLDFEAPYSEVKFPPNAVHSPLAIEVIPHYNVQVGLDGKSLATSVVEFKSAEPLIFELPVRVKLRTPYIPISRNNPVYLQIVRSKNDGPFEYFTSAKLEKDSKFVSFWCKTFCRFAGMLDTSATVQTGKRYYTAAITRDSDDSRNREISWMVCEDMPNTNELNKKYFEINDHRRLIDAQSFDLGPSNYELHLKLTHVGWHGCGNTTVAHETDVNIWPDEGKILVRNSLGFDRKKTLSISVRKEDDKTKQKLTYRILAEDRGDNLRSGDVFEPSECILDWSKKPTTDGSLIVNASGPGSMGFNVTYGTSGYGSAPHQSDISTQQHSRLFSNLEGSVESSETDPRNIISTTASFIRNPSQSYLAVSHQFDNAAQVPLCPTDSQEPNDETVPEETISFVSGGPGLKSTNFTHDSGHSVGTSVDPPQAVGSGTSAVQRSTIVEDVSDVNESPSDSQNDSRTSPKELEGSDGFEKM